MPSVPESDIVSVTDEATCQRASAMLDSVFFTAPRASTVYVVRIGTRYAVYPPAVSLGEFGYVIHADSVFRKVGVGAI